MPTTEDIDYLDGEFTVQEESPSTLDELKALIGEQGIIDETTSNLRYRNKYPRVYRKVSEAIVGKHPRAVTKEETKADGTIKKTFQSVMDHIRDYVKTSDEAKKEVGELFASIGPAEALYVKGERAGGGGKLSQSALDAANQAFASGQADTYVEFIESTVPGYKIAKDADGAATPESLARGIQALESHLKKQQPKALDVLKKAVA
jgi:hypothetical protein